MKELTLGAALQKAHGLREELDRTLVGRHAEEGLEALGRFLRKEKDPWGVDALQGKYQRVGVATVVGEDPFVAKDRFLVDKTPAARVKIGYMNDDFQAQFLPIMEEGVGEARLAASDFWRRDGYTALPAVFVLSDVGCRHSVRLAHIWGLLRYQRNGKDSGEGILNAGDGPNVFYSYGTGGHLWVIDVRWGYRPNNKNEGGDVFCYDAWGIYAFPLRHSVLSTSRIFSVVE